MEVFRLTDIIFLILAVLALVFAGKQYLDARSAKEDTDNLRRKVEVLTLELGTIKEGLSTRAIARFPNNVPEVCKLLDSCAENSGMWIMADNIGYTLYSQRSNFDAYLHSLQSAIRRKVKIRLLVYDYSRTKRAIRRQYPSISEECNKDRFTDFFRRLQKPNAANEKEFYRALLLAEENLYHAIAGVEMKLLAEEPPALFWLKDDPHAVVFSFRDEFPGTGFSFESEDSNLVRQFKVMFDTHWERAEEHWDCRW